MTNVSLDLESVLAEPNQAVTDATEQLTLDQIEKTWFGNGKNNENYQIYMGVSDAIWRHNPEVIPQEEPCIDEYTAKLQDRVENLDIVTHRQHVDKQVVWWLEEHNVQYDNFVSCSVPKEQLDYDLYIDDNPKLFGNCRLLLRHQPWNAYLAANESKMCDRIHTLSESVAFV
jgi:hypothetical protein